MLFRNLFLLALLLTGISIISFSQSNQSLIQSYLEEHKDDLKLSAADISDWVIYNEHSSEKFGVTYMYLRQRVNGIELYNSGGTFAIKGGQVFFSGDRMTRDIDKMPLSGTATITAEESIGFAANQLGLGSIGAVEKLKSNKRLGKYIFESDVSMEQIPVKQVYVPTEDGLRLAWNLNIYESSQQHWWSVSIDAITGVILTKVDWVVTCNYDHNGVKCSENHQSIEVNNAHESLLLLPPPPGTDQYNVFPIPVESPNHGSRALVIGPSDPIASPFGWHDDDGIAGNEYTETQGNNVLAQEDANGNNGTGVRADGGAALDFDFPLNLNQAPSGYLDAAITNLFYMNNIMHDVWYHYGFDEASGNFQENNYGNGGVGSDYVRADAQDGSGTNNANFATPDEGANPRMQMFLWNGTPNFLTINAPGSIAGPYLSEQASFGPGVPTAAPLTANVVVFDDGSANPTEACNAAVNGAALTGSIAIIRRGNCSFVNKVVNAEAAGALAVIVVNNVGTAPFSMGGTDPGIGIPSVMVSQVDGESMIAEILAGFTVSATLFDGLVYDKDGDFDNVIIAHEYGHGISNRLTGGASNSNCLSNAEQMGEGWSDWFGLMLSMEPGDTETDNRGVGTYVTGESTTGTGIRPAPYNTDFNVNGFTYAATNNTGSISQPHGIGFVWATMLWDMTWALIDRYGFDPDVYYGTGGNNVAMHLVMNALKLQPCSPGFVDGRDAILQADMLLYNGANQCLIWNVFANRGLGFSADQGSSNSRTDQIEAFDVPTGLLNSSGSETASACGSYTWGTSGQTYTTTGAYQAILPNAVGCDSVITLDLVINDVSTSSESVVTCSDYVWSTNGATYTSTGQYNAILTNAVGCDSTVTLDLIVNPEYDVTETVTACTAYTWPVNGNTYNATGVYTESLTTVNGCDSTITLDFTLSTSAATNESITACDSYTWPASGTNYLTTGTYSTTLTSSTGCDSIVTLNLTVNNANSGNESMVSCDNYLWPANGQTYNSTGAYTTVLTNAAGCDSVVTLDLIINNASNNQTQSVNACDSYTWSASGQTYFSSGVYNTSLTNVNGCDSSLVLDLNLGTSNTASQTAAACDSYVWSADGNTYTQSGSYDVVLINAEGCDSTVTLNLTINTISTSINTLNPTTLNVSPSGASYQWIDCDNNAPIPGETSQFFSPTQNGNYACVVDFNGCIDTTDCRSIGIIGIIENSFGEGLNVYPNPTSDKITIDFGIILEEVDIKLMNIIGQEIETNTILEGASFEMNIDGASGVYLLELSSGNAKATVRVLKE